MRFRRFDSETPEQGYWHERCNYLGERGSENNSRRSPSKHIQ
jgi:hypothetical protein